MTAATQETGPGELQSLTVTMNGSALPPDWEAGLYSVAIDRQLCLSSRAVLRFHDTAFMLGESGTASVGAKVAIAASGVTLLTGTVTAVTVEQRPGQSPELHVTVDDAAYQLALVTSTAAYLRTTYDDVIRQTMQAVGITVNISDGDGTVYDYLLQSGTPLDYLNEVAARTGRVWWVDDTTLHLAKPDSEGSPVTITLGKQLHSVSVRASGMRPAAVTVAGWDPAQLASVEPSVQPTTTLRVGPDQLRGKPLTTQAVTVRGTRSVASAEATTVAQAIADDAAKASVVARGECDFDAAIVPGSLLSIEQAGPANGVYLVTAVEQLADPSEGLRTRFTAGPLRPSGLVDLLAEAQRSGAGMRIPGVLPAVVTNVQDNEHKGRVKVKYSTQGDQVESPWARLVTIGGGKDRGFEFAPEVGDEVLVGFEEGDTRRPVVLGGLYSDKNAFPGAKTQGNLDGDKIGYRRITSRLGHTVEFADGEAESSQHILLQLAGGNHRIRLGADKLDVVTGDLPISVTNGQATVSLAKNGDISLEGNNVSIKANGKLTLEAPQGQFSAKGLQVEVDATTTLKLQGGQMASLEASEGATAVKGLTVAIN